MARYRTQHHRKHPHRTRHAGTPSVRLPCHWLPIVAGCRHTAAGLVATDSGVLVAHWSGTPGASSLEDTQL